MIADSGGASRWEESQLTSQRAHALALASLRGVGPRSLRALLKDRAPLQAWSELVAGEHPANDSESLTRQASRFDVDAAWEAHQGLGIGVVALGDSSYPDLLAMDPEAPAVLFYLGNLGLVSSYPRVAVVGTRSATRYGLGLASRFGTELAMAGVAVVSGLALGIDGASHEGACAARRACGGSAGPPIAVVAGGLDVPYPRAHERLWQQVAELGVVISEAPLGTVEARWRFPTRNRVLAALSSFVLIVESHQSGGSLHTVRAARERGIQVGAVPGSVHSPASAGTNDLLASGCMVVRDSSDVLVALGSTGDGVNPNVGAVSQQPSLGAVMEAAVSERSGLVSAAPERPASMGDLAVLEALDWEPCSVEQVMRRTKLSLANVSVALERLSTKGLVTDEGGWWRRVSQ